MWANIGLVIVFALFVYLGRRGDGAFHADDKRNEIPSGHGNQLGGGPFG